MKRLRSQAWLAVSAAAFFSALPLTLYAQPAVSQEDLRKEIRELKETVRQQAARIDELERRVAAPQPPAAAEQCAVPGELPRKAEDHREETATAYPWMQGVEFDGWATMILQGAGHANGPGHPGGDSDVTDASYTLDMTVEKKFEDCASAFVHMRAGNGAGLNDDLTLFSNVNYNADDAGNDVRIVEAWYEQYFGSMPLTLTVGKLDPLSYIDDNLYAYDETTQFLGDMFCNSPVIEFPPNIGEGGIRLGFKPWQGVGVELLATDSYGTGEDVFDALFLAGQVTFSPAVCSRNGNYRFLVWQNGANHTRWNDPAKTKEHSYGYGISFDQEITDVIGLFLRYGWQDPQVYLSDNSFSLEQSYSFGSQMKGIPWGRPADTMGLAFGQVFPSSKYKEANDLNADPETHLEWYYDLKITEHFAVTPDVQVIWKPYGTDAPDGDDTIVVGGLRGEVDF